MAAFIFGSYCIAGLIVWAAAWAGYLWAGGGPGPRTPEGIARGLILGIAAWPFMVGFMAYWLIRAKNELKESGRV